MLVSTRRPCDKPATCSPMIAGKAQDKRLIETGRTDHLQIFEKYNQKHNLNCKMSKLPLPATLGFCLFSPFDAPLQVQVYPYSKILVGSTLRRRHETVVNLSFSWLIENIDLTDLWFVLATNQKKDAL